MPKKLAALCLAAVMGVSVTACSGGNMYATSNESATIADNDVITIGSVTTNSGAAAAYGEAEVNGFKLAVKEINADGGIFGKQIKLESMDDKGDVIEASNAFNRLAGDKNVIAVLGPTISSTSGAVAPLADQNQMPTIARPQPPIPWKRADTCSAPASRTPTRARSPPSMRPKH